MLTFLVVLLTVMVVVQFCIQLGALPRLAIRVRRSRRLKRLLPDALVLAAFRLTPVGGGMGNLLVGGPNLYGGTGVPTDAAVGSSGQGPQNGDVYFRVDGGAGTTIYQRRAGVWTATAA